MKKKSHEGPQKEGAYLQCVNNHLTKFEYLRNKFVCS